MRDECDYKIRANSEEELFFQGTELTNNFDGFTCIN